MLPSQCSPDTVQLRRGLITQGAVRLDLPLQTPQQRLQIVSQQRCGERLHCWPRLLHRIRRRHNQLPPGLHTLGVRQSPQQLLSLQRRARNPCLGERVLDVVDPAKLERQSAREQNAHFGRALLLRFDPGKLGRRLQPTEHALPKGTLRTARHALPQGLPLQRSPASFLQNRWYFWQLHSVPLESNYRLNGAEPL